MKHILTADQFSREEIENIFESAKEMIGWQPLGHNFLMGSLFFEPSTRTRLSFESACQRLGGKIISVENGKVSSSATKGESLKDTVRTVSQFVDVLVIRHPQEGGVQDAAKVSDVPVINGGDGSGEHPTQALLDAYTIWKERGNIGKPLDRLRVLFLGDVKHARTLNSLETILDKFDVNLSKVDMTEKIDKDDLVKHLKVSDVVYMTRVQTERHDNIKDLNYWDQCEALMDALPSMKKDALIMHPLPRGPELPSIIDKDPRAIYFKQVKNGMYVRMALLKMCLDH